MQCRVSSRAEATEFILTESASAFPAGKASNVQLHPTSAWTRTVTDTENVDLTANASVRTDTREKPAKNVSYFC